MDRKTFEVTVDGQSLTLPLKEFELLFKLASYPGRTFSREQLIEDIWGYDFDGNDRTLDVHINRLRERFPEETALLQDHHHPRVGLPPGGETMRVEDSQRCFRDFVVHSSFCSHHGFVCGWLSI